MFRQILIKKDKKNCPQCGESIEWTGGKVDETQQEYMCKGCRVFVKIIGFSEEDQDIIAEEAFM